MSTSPTVPLVVSPTAHTSLLAIAATAYRWFCGRKPFGLGMKVQAVPSQCSVRVCQGSYGCPPVYDPTAHTSFGATPATPLRITFPELGSGLDTWVQLVPSPCNVNV